MIESYVRTKPPSVTDRSKVSRWRKKTAEKVCVQQNREASGRATVDEHVCGAPQAAICE